MILSSHIIVASAATVSLINRPASVFNALAIFVIALLSHYLVDLIPHWDYKIWSIKEDDDEAEKTILKKNTDKILLPNKKFTGLR